MPNSRRRMTLMQVLCEKMVNMFVERLCLVANGRRVIGFVHKLFSASTPQFSMDEGNFPLSDLVFVGICAIMDPPR